VLCYQCRAKSSAVAPLDFRRGVEECVLRCHRNLRLLRRTVTNGLRIARCWTCATWAGEGRSPTRAGPLPPRREGQPSKTRATDQMNETMFRRGNNRRPRLREKEGEGAPSSIFVLHLVCPFVCSARVEAWGGHHSSVHFIVRSICFATHT